MLFRSGAGDEDEVRDARRVHGVRSRVSVPPSRVLVSGVHCVAFELSLNLKGLDYRWPWLQQYDPPASAD